MAGKREAATDCWTCGLKARKRGQEINYRYTYRDGNRIVWYSVCKACELAGRRIADK